MTQEDVHSDAVQALAGGTISALKTIVFQNMIKQSSWLLREGIAS